MTVKFVKATAADAKEQCAIQKEAFLPLYEKYQDEESPYNTTVEEIESKIGNPFAAYYVILADEKAVGGIYVYPTDPNSKEEMYLCAVYVKPEMQGKGLAQGAIGYIETLFPECKRWILDVPESEPKNIHVYEKMGYKKTDYREVINDKLAIIGYIKAMN